MQLALGQGDMNRVAGRDRRRISQGVCFVGVPRDGVPAAEHRERAQGVEPPGNVPELRGSAMLALANGAVEPAARCHEPRADAGEAPARVECGQLALEHLTPPLSNREVGADDSSERVRQFRRVASPHR